MKKADFLLAVFFFILGLAASWGFYYYQNIQKEEQGRVDVSTVPFRLVPPAEAISGNLVNMKGKIYKKARGEEDFKIIEQDINVIEGESLKTDNDSSVDVIFEGIGKSSLDPNSQIILTNLNPKNFIISQEQGSIKYENISDDSTISVRVGIVLFEMSKGKALIIFDFAGGTVEVEQITGVGKAAWVDEQNETKVRELRERDEFVL